MYNIIKIKRGEGAPPTLAVGELGFQTDTEILWIGTTEGNVKISSDAYGFQEMLDRFITVYDKDPEDTTHPSRKKVCPLVNGKIPAKHIPSSTDNIQVVHRVLDLGGAVFEAPADILGQDSGVYYDDFGFPLQTRQGEDYTFIISNPDGHDTYVWQVWGITTGGGIYVPYFIKDVEMDDVVYICEADNKIYRFSSQENYPIRVDAPPEEINGGTW